MPRDTWVSTQQGLRVAQSGGTVGWHTETRRTWHLQTRHQWNFQPVLTNLHIPDPCKKPAVHIVRYINIFHRIYQIFIGRWLQCTILLQTRCWQLYGSRPFASFALQPCINYLYEAKSLLTVKLVWCWSDNREPDTVAVARRACSCYQSDSRPDGL